MIREDLLWHYKCSDEYGNEYYNSYDDPRQCHAPIPVFALNIWKNTHTHLFKYHIEMTKTDTIHFFHF